MNNILKTFYLHLGENIVSLIEVRAVKSPKTKDALPNTTNKVVAKLVCFFTSNERNLNEPQPLTTFQTHPHSTFHRS